MFGSFQEVPKAKYLDITIFYCNECGNFENKYDDDLDEEVQILANRIFSQNDIRFSKLNDIVTIDVNRYSIKVETEGNFDIRIFENGEYCLFEAAESRLNSLQNYHHLFCYNH